MAKKFSFYKFGNALKKIDREFAINCGGCGAFAMRLGKILIDAGYEVKVAMLGGTAERPVEEISRILQRHNRLTNGATTVRHWNRYGIENCHVMLHVRIEGNWWFVDSTGVHDEHSYGLAEFISYEDLCTFADKPQGWNSMFDRRDLPTIEGMLYTHVAPVIQQYAEVSNEN